jgi:tetratricopeptide (TPR) repeat protein
MGGRKGEANGTGCLGSVFLSLGRIADAREHFERQLALAREMGDRPQEATALVALAEAASESDDGRLAERLLAEALEIRRSMGARADEAWILLARGRLLARGGRGDEARADLASALSIGRELSLPGVELAASTQLVRLPGGDVPTALSALAAHVDRVPVKVLMEACFLLWQATHDRTHLAEARRLLDFLVEHAPPDCRETMIANVRLHREIAAAAKEAGA